MRPSRAAAVAFAALAAAATAAASLACVDQREAPLPPLDPGGALLLTFSQRDRLVRIFAADVDDAGHTTIPAFTYARSAAAVYALTYPCSLAALALDPGEQKDPELAPIPPGETRYLLRVPDDGAPTWEPNEGLRPAELRRAPRTQCADLTITASVTIPGSDTGFVSSAAALDDHRALIAIIRSPSPEDPRADPFWLLTRTATGATLTRAPIPPGTPNLAAFTAADGRIFLLGYFGIVASGDLQRGFQATSTLTTTRSYSLAWLDGNGPRAPDRPLELYALTDARVFERYDDTTGRWSALRDFGPCRAGDDDCFLGGILWRGPSDAIAMVPEIYNSIAVYQGGELSVDQYLNAALRQIAITAAYVPGWGTVVGTEIGSLFVGDGHLWTQVQGFTLEHGLRLITLDESVLCGCNGVLTEVHPVDGICAASAMPIEPDIQRMLTVGSERLILSQAKERPINARFVSWKRTREGCPASPASSAN